jgi:hypothetical protein
VVLEHDAGDGVRFSRQTPAGVEVGLLLLLIGSSGSSGRWGSRGCRRVTVTFAVRVAVVRPVCPVRLRS